MDRGPVVTVLQHLRRLARDDEASDGALLRRFAGRRDEEAFAALVRRHAALVWDVCRGLLRDEHDAEDAFQATFFVLARKAGSVRKYESAAGWLYGVACRVAARARRDAARRRAHERQAAVMAQPDPAPAADADELRAAVHEEIRRLPERYRDAVVLSYLQGKTCEEAAALLGCPVGTVKSRLARARDLLRPRLARRGLAPAALALPPRAAPAALVEAAARAAAGEVSARAAALAEGVMRAMLTTRLRLAAAVALTVGLLGTGAGVLARRAPAGRPAEAGQQESSQKRETKEEKTARLDLHGDPLPPAALARLGTVRWRHGCQVLALAFAPGGKALASGGADGVVHLWDVATGREVRRWQGGPDGWVTAVAFAPDGKALAVGDGGAVHLWEAATGRELRRFQGEKVRVGSLAFSADGSLLVGGGGLGEGSVYLWEVATGKLLRQFGGPAGALSPDGKVLATGDLCAPVVTLWDAATGREVGRLRGDQEKGIRGVAFSPDGKALAAAGLGGAITLWDVAAGKEARRLEGHRSKWGGAVGECDQSDWSFTLAFSADGKLLASGGEDTDVRLWDAAAGKELRRFESDGHALALAADGKALAAGSAHTVRLWEAATGKEVRAFGGHQDGVRPLAFSPDGRLATVGKSGLPAAGGSDLRLWEAATGKELRRAELPGGWAYDAAFSPDGRTLALHLEAEGGRSGYVLALWDAAAGKEPRRLGEAPPGRRALAFSPDGRLLAAGGWDDGRRRQRIRLWEAATGKEVRAFDAPWAGPLAFSPDGRLLASAKQSIGDEDPENTVRLWDVAAGKEVRRCGEPGHAVSALAFAPDGRALATAGYRGDEGEDFAVKLWDVATGKKLRQFQPRRGREYVLALAFSPDGKSLAAAGGDGTVRLWEAATGKERRAFTGHRDEVWSLAFSSDGRALASGSADTTALVWDLTGRADARAEPRLTPENLDALWQDLAGDDAAKAYRAVRALAAAPAEAVPYLGRHLRPAPPADPGRLRRLLADLDDDEFDVRQKAADELEKLADLAEPALREALKGEPSLELRKRVEALLDKADGRELSPQQLTELRAVEALEQISTKEARQLLEELAKGAPAARLTREAQAALRRLGARSQETP